MKKSNTTYFHKVISAVLIIALLHLSISCRYFKVIETVPEDLNQTAKVDKKPNYFILHYQNKQYTLKNVTLDSSAISGTITTLDANTWYYEGRGNRIKAGENSIVNEVHLYVKDSFEIENLYGARSIPLEYLEEAKIIDMNTGATVASIVFGTLGVGVAIILIVALLSARPKPKTTSSSSSSSCPYVYSFDGENFIFEGETFGGANMKSLERQDFMPLPALQVQGNQVKLQINNELEEKHFIDLANLVAVSHPEGTTVLLDVNGKPHLISSPQHPIAATTTRRIDLSTTVLEKDGRNIMFVEEDENINGVILKFKNDPRAGEAKLLLRAKNSLWLDFLYSKFTEKFGSYFETWVQKKSREPYQERWQRVVEEGIPLKISVLKNKEWMLVKHIPTVGPMAMRDLVIPIDKKEIEGDILIKLETGFMFWEVDYAALDFSKNTNLSISTFQPDQVISSDHLQWKEALKYADGKYMEQPEKGMTAELTFILPDHVTDENHSFFLHSEGYYEVTRNYSGLPQINELRKFNKTGHFPEYSRELYHSLAKENIHLTSSNSK